MARGDRDGTRVARHFCVAILLLAGCGVSFSPRGRAVSSVRLTVSQELALNTTRAGAIFMSAIA